MEQNECRIENLNIPNDALTNCQKTDNSDGLQCDATFDSDVASSSKHLHSSSASISTSSSSLLSTTSSSLTNSKKTLNENDQNNGTSPSKSGNPEEEQSQIPALLKLNTYKAGLEGLDTDRANKLIKLAGSRAGSRFYEHQEKRQKRIDAQIAGLCRKADQLDEQKRKSAMLKADSMLREMECQRLLNKVIVHFDMDMFFAACEIKANPDLADKPMAVGSTSMISTSNYVARKFGVRSAMAGFIAKRLCPELILVPPHFSLYKKESNVIMKIIQEYDPNPSSASLDEVYIDLTDYLFEAYSQKNDIPLENLYKFTELPDDVWNMAAEIVTTIRERVFDVSKLTVSAGISCNTMVAKICTDMNKPNGQFMVKGRRNEIMEFVASLKLRKFPGVGPVRGQMLAGLGMETAKDIYPKRDLIVSLFSDLSSYDTFRLYLGIGSTHLSSQEESAQKSHSRETTMGDTNKHDELICILQSLTEQVSRDLRRHHQIGRTITLKLKKSSFEVFLKSKSIPHHTDDETILFRVIKELFQQEYSSCPTQCYRLVGVKISSLKDKQIIRDEQATLEKMFGEKFKKDDNRSINDGDKHKKKNILFKCRLCDEEFENNEMLSIHKLDCNGDFFTADDNDDDDVKDNVDSTVNDDDNNEDLSIINRFNTSNNKRQIIESVIQIDESSSSSSLSVKSSSSSLSSSTSRNISKNKNPTKKVQIFDSATETFLCPVCNMNLIFDDNLSLNAHIDTCLNRNICSELTKVQPKILPSSSSSLVQSSSSIKTTSNTSTSPTKLTSNNKKGQKRKKNSDKIANTKSPCKAIDSYFYRLPSSST